MGKVNRLVKGPGVTGIQSGEKVSKTRSAFSSLSGNRFSAKWTSYSVRWLQARVTSARARP